MVALRNVLLFSVFCAIVLAAGSYAGQHYRVTGHGFDLDPDQGGRFVHFAEAARRMHTDSYGHPGNSLWQIDLKPRVVLRGREYGGAAYIGEKRIEAVYRDYIPRGDVQTSSTLSHEISHQVLHSRMGYPPTWFDEGLAMTAVAAIDTTGVDGSEKNAWLTAPVRPMYSNNMYRTGWSVARRRETFVPVDKLVTLSYYQFHDTNEMEHYYQSKNLMAHLRKKYPQSFRAFVSDAIGTGDPVSALTRHLNIRRVNRELYEYWVGEPYPVALTELERDEMAREDAAAEKRMIAERAGEGALHGRRANLNPADRDAKPDEENDADEDPDAEDDRDPADRIAEINEQAEKDLLENHLRQPEPPKPFAVSPIEKLDYFQLWCHVADKGRSDALGRSLAELRADYDRLSLKYFDRNGDGALNEVERATRNAALNRIRYSIVPYVDADKNDRIEHDERGRAIALFKALSFAGTLREFPADVACVDKVDATIDGIGQAARLMNAGRELEKLRAVDADAQDDAARARIDNLDYLILSGRRRYLDRNGDGKIGTAEIELFKKMEGVWKNEILDVFDKDKDGKILGTELIRLNAYFKTCAEGF